MDAGEYKHVVLGITINQHAQPKPIIAHRNFQDQAPDVMWSLLGLPL